MAEDEGGPPGPDVYWQEGLDHFNLYFCLQTEEKFCQALQIHIDRLKKAQDAQDTILLEKYVRQAKIHANDPVLDDLIMGLNLHDELIRVSYPRENTDEEVIRETQTDGKKKKRFNFRVKRSTRFDINNTKFSVMSGKRIFGTNFGPNFGFRV